MYVWERAEKINITKRTQVSNGQMSIALNTALFLREGTSVHLQSSIWEWGAEEKRKGVRRGKKDES